MTTVEERAESGGRGVSQEVLRGFFREMLLIRRFEEKVEDRFRAGELPGFLHVAIGQEATATGVCAALTREDVIASTHRAHGHAIAKGTPIDRIKELALFAVSREYFQVRKAVGAALVAQQQQAG